MTIRFLTLSNPTSDIQYLDALFALAERAQQASPHLYPNGRDFYERNLQGATVNVLAFDGERLIGYAALRTMEPWPAYLDAPQYPPAQCALMLLNLVAPDYRGQGVGHRLALARIKAARARGFRHLFATVHPDNHASMKVLERQDFRLIAQRPMFTEQLLRNLMQKDVDQAVA